VKTSSSAGVGWVPLFGEFDVAEKETRFKGKNVRSPAADGVVSAEAVEQASLGLLISSLTLADGDVTAEVEFDEVSEKTICELAVAYDPNANHVATAGLGGAEWAMFAIREYGGPKTGGQSWWVHRAGGERASIRAGKKYRLEARYRGAMLTLLLDGVLVGTAEVASPLGRARQVGILCRGAHGIVIRDFRVEAAKPKAFVVMQFGSEYDEVYQDVVKEICKDYEVNVLRADEVSGPGLIIADIVREISTSQLVIADITPLNANVYFEVGYALALGKPTILLATKGTALPFDVAGFRVLFYENTIGGKAKLEEGLRKHLNALLRI
jgi:hypothetical protein